MVRGRGKGTTMLLGLPLCGGQKDVCVSRGQPLRVCVCRRSQITKEMSCGREGERIIEKIMEATEKTCHLIHIQAPKKAKESPLSCSQAEEQESMRVCK